VLTSTIPLDGYLAFRTSISKSRDSGCREFLLCLVTALVIFSYGGLASLTIVPWDLAFVTSDIATFVADHLTALDIVVYLAAAAAGMSAPAKVLKVFNLVSSHVVSIPI